MMRQINITRIPILGVFLALILLITTAGDISWALAGGDHDGPPDGRRRRCLGFWRLRGNAGADPDLGCFLGTTDSHDLAIRTNDREAIRIDTDGQVGIGTTSPNAQLEIESHADRMQALIRAFPGQGAPILKVYENAERPVVEIDRKGKAFFGVGFKAWASIDAFDRPSGISDPPILEINSGPGPDGNVIVRPRFANFLALTVRGLVSQAENLQEWQDSDRNALSVVDANGRVGIGTASPNSSLEVSNGYVELDTSDGTPPPIDCDAPDEIGRMKVDGASKILYICMSDPTDGINWATITP